MSPTGGPSVIRRFVGTFACLVGVSIAYCTYALTFASTIEPAYHTTETSDDNEFWQTTASNHRQILKTLFPPNAWQLQHPKAIETRHGILLFQEYQRNGDEFVIKPCTYIIFQGDVDSTAGLTTDNNPTTTNDSPRIITLNAVNGAVISANILTESNATGTIPTGRLIGDVLIHSKESQPNANDAFRIETRNIQFEKNQIWTTHDVNFQYGDHEGQGRDLVINLKEIEPSRIASDRDSPVSQIDSIELIDVDFMRLLINQSFFAKKTPANNKPNPGQMLIHCQGPLRIDFSNSLITLEDQVDMVVSQPGQSDDRMQCERLELSFSMPNQIPLDPSIPSALQPTNVFTFQSLTATGNPLLIESPKQQLTIRGQTVSFDMVEGMFSIEDSQQSTVNIGNHQFEVASFQYQMVADLKQLGVFVAKGAGSFHSTDPDSAENVITVSWNRNCTLEKLENEHLLSLEGKAEINLSGVGKISSDRIHIWLEESLDSSHQANSQASKNKITPVRILASGDTFLDTVELQANTQRAEVWLRKQVSATGDSSNSPAPSLPTNDDDTIGQTGPRYVVQGDLIQIQLAQKDGKHILQEALIKDKLVLRQVSNSPGARSPFVLHGNSVNLKRDLAGLFDMTLTGNSDRGQPAWIAFEEFQISGNQIRFNQLQNLMWIKGAGEIAFNPLDNTTTPQTRRISWQEQMAFDGSLIELFGNVKTRGLFTTDEETTFDLTLDSGVLRGYLTKRVDFSSPERRAPAELHMLRCSNTVAISNRVLDTNKLQQAFHQMQANNLSFYPKSGEIKSSGRGWIRSTFRNNGKALGTALEANTTGPLQSLYVTFKKSVAGNITQQHLTFSGNVKSLFGTVDNWNVKLDPNATAGMGAPEIELNCDQLSIANISPNSKPSITLNASGNTYIESQQYVGLAHRVTYSQSKNNLIMEGGRGDAKLWINRNKSPVPNVAARKIIYFIETGTVDVYAPNVLDSGRTP
jgi:hypothetical protein